MTTKIAWTNTTLNPIVGCSKISPGCDNCYAERMAVRQKAMEIARGCKTKKYLSTVDDNGKWTGQIGISEKVLAEPLHWKKPRMVFVSSMGDLFHPNVPFEWIDKVMAIITLCPQHQFQFLTKRAERMAEYFLSDRSDNINEEIEKYTGGHLASGDMVESFCVKNGITRQFRGRLNENENIWANRIYMNSSAWLPPNLWLGVTAENQEMADLRIPKLLEIPAAVRFVSFEPMLDFFYVLYLRFTELDWVIIGAETGPGARPMKLKWAEKMVSNCKKAGVPCFVKALPVNGRVTDDMKLWPKDMQVRQWPVEIDKPLLQS